MSHSRQNERDLSQALLTIVADFSSTISGTGDGNYIILQLMSSSFIMCLTKFLTQSFITWLALVAFER
ncbi:MAG: hypothetical protein EBY92_05385 [Actinobacteria bacterium]|nr:hypothetical protein [Actinomycetota bacterium]